MGVSKVNLGEETLVDLTSDTVNPQNLLKGATAHGADGESVEGGVTVAPLTTSLAVNEEGVSALDAAAGKVLNDKFGGCSFEQEGEDFYIVGADSVRKKLQGSEFFSVTGEFVASIAGNTVNCGFKPTHVILVNRYAGYENLVQFYMPESSFIFSGGSFQTWNKETNYFNIELTSDGFAVKSPSSYASYKTFYYAFKV